MRINSAAESRRGNKRACRWEQLIDEATDELSRLQDAADEQRQALLAEEHSLVDARARLTALRQEHQRVQDAAWAAAAKAEAAQRGRFVPLWKVYYYHRNLLLLYRMAAGWLFWPALLVILPKWISKVRLHQGERRAFLRLMGRAVGDGLIRRSHVPHAEVLDLARRADR